MCGLFYRQKPVETLPIASVPLAPPVRLLEVSIAYALAVSSFAYEYDELHNTNETLAKPVPPSRLAGGLASRVVRASTRLASPPAIEAQIDNDARPTNGRPLNRKFWYVLRGIINLSPNKRLDE
jgi:hypothetical protein